MVELGVVSPVLSLYWLLYIGRRMAKRELGVESISGHPSFKPGKNFVLSEGLEKTTVPATTLKKSDTFEH